MLTILLVFRWKMGGLKPTIFSVLPAGIGSLWTLGLVGWFGGEASILTAVAPIFIIVIGSADGLHFMSHFQDSKLEGDTTFDSITKTLQIVGIPMIITTLTSMVGFLSLLSMNTDSIVDLAIYSSIGIFLAGVATWLILPLILSNEIDVLPKSKRERKNHLENILKKV
jgi:predicted RND superfamily exporter protein